MALKEIVGNVGGNFVAPTKWRADIHAQYVRENFIETEVRLAALEAVNPVGVAALLKVTVTLNNTEIKALPTTSITLVAAQGAGKRIVPVHIDLFGNFTAAAYTNVSTNDARLFAQIGSSNWTSSLLVGSVESSLGDFAAFFGVAAKVQASFRPWAPTSANWGAVTFGDSAAASQINTALKLVISSGGGDLTGGNAANTLKARVLYMVEDD